MEYDLEDGALDRMMDASGPWEANEHGLWCPECGECIATPWMFERDEQYSPRASCKDCGYPHD